jgi:hypothetical protein
MLIHQNERVQFHFAYYSNKTQQVARQSTNNWCKDKAENAA